MLVERSPHKREIRDRTPSLSTSTVIHNRLESELGSIPRRSNRCLSTQPCPKNFYLLILYMKIINVDVLRLPPAALILDVIPKESKI